MQRASVSLSVLNQLPDFVKENSPQFEQFLSYYYKSQEKISGPIGVLNNLTDYLDVSKYDLTKLDGNSNLIADISKISNIIEVETTDGFVEQNGTIIIDNEVIYYETLKKSPDVIISPGISYPEFSKKSVELFNIYLLFNNTRTSFPLKLNNSPIFPPSPHHLVVKIYNEYLIPGIDFTVVGDQIIFSTPPRTFDPINLSDASNDVQLKYQKGFDDSIIDVLDTLIPASRTTFTLRKNTNLYFPASTVLTVVIADGELLVPLKDYSIFENKIIFAVAPTQSIYIAYINAPLVSSGINAQAYSIVNNFGQIERIIVKNGGSEYTPENNPRVILSGSTGVNATAKCLIGGLISISLLEGGNGYSQENPPYVVITDPEKENSTVATASATINSDGQVSNLTLINSGSGYDFIPRIQFINPSGAKLGTPVVTNGILQSIPVLSGGIGYTNPPKIYIDSPESEIGNQALCESVLNSSGQVISVTVLTGGTGYSNLNLPRCRVIEPTGAQILDVDVDDFGRVINIELLTGGFGYSDVPSVYIVDERKDFSGNYSGGVGAKAIATIFNGQIIDINITDFGSGYSSQFPPKIYISSPSGAKSSCEIGSDQITGYEIINPGSGYEKSQFVNCARGVSGIVDYDSNNNIIFKKESQSISTIHYANTTVRSLDSIFLKKILDRIINQYLPGIPNLDTQTLNITNILSTIKDFYASKGTIYSVKYLFKLLYGTSVEVSYPKDQMIKPSASTWSIDTVLRSRIVSGNPINLKDSLLEQNKDPVDSNVQYASALIENYTAIQTSVFDIYELILSEETIQGYFVIPYSTKLLEGLDPDSLIVDVDSTIGWPERNGEVLIGDEIIRYKEKSLTQFIECTRGINGTIAQNWDAGTTCSSTFYVYSNQGTNKEVVLSILGIVDANQTSLTDDGSYYLEGDKLTVSKLGLDDTSKLVTSWLYNVKKLLKVDNITFGGVNNQTATVTCEAPHGLLVGDQVTIYGANPIVYNGSFLVTSRESALVFKYNLPQPTQLNPQGNILISIDLNRGKSDSQSINTAISKFPANIQNTFIGDDVYIAATGIPNYKIGPFLGTALLPGNQRKLYRFPKIPNTISVKTETIPGAIGSFVNGVSVWNYKSENKYKFGPLTNINIIDPGSLYDASVPPVMTISGGGGTDALASVIIDGSVVEFEIISGGTGYTTSPLVSIYGSAGIGASATAITTNGVVSRILVNTSGNGYISEPTVSVTGGGGIGAIARAIVRGPIKQVNIDNSGSSYTSIPSVSLSSGSGAAAQPYVNNGRIASIAIISAGSGYTTAPKVIITGDGFGAVAKSIISTEGADLGRVTSIIILNRGIGYTSGTTQIRLESIGQGASFQADIFEWTFNLNDSTTFDYASGSIFEGFNNQFGGEYGHISNPKQLRYVLGDNLDLIDGQVVERDSVLHSPILGWAFDGNPIYGPYGLSDPTQLSSNIVQIRSGYKLKTNVVYDATTNPNPYRIEGPSLSQYPAGIFIEDYEYTFNSLSIYLDEYNGRYTKTPDFPDGIYAYYVTLDAAGLAEFPYIMGPKFYSKPDIWNLNQFAVQSNIPSGVVRYRTPFENVDIDVERIPNETTNALTLENGDFLLFDVEDENKDGIINQDETDDPNIVFEESKLEIFDYFPKINISSKVDIEVETTTKFEDAKVTGFTIENRGDSYQVNDRLVFDDTDTSGYGASARIAEIVGENITSYTYEYNSTLDVYKGNIQTVGSHNLVVGDIVNVSTITQMEPTSKSIVVKSIRGIENINVSQEGVGYDPELPPTISIESTSGQYSSLLPIISSSGVISDLVIKNSGFGYIEDPIIRISHPQTRKKSDYFYSTHAEDINLVINNAVVSSIDKSIYLVGKSKTTNNNSHGILQKVSNDGSLIWSKSLSSNQPSVGVRNCEFTAVYKKNNNIYVVGITKPNQSLYEAFNPDIIVAKYIESEGGTSATLSWQRELAGISGVTRADYATDITEIGDNFMITGYTSTNTTSVYDGFLIYINSSGDVISKRKIASSAASEKIYQIKTDSDGGIYIIGQSGSNQILISKISISSNRILISWTKQISLSSYKFDNISFDIDEYDQIYIVSTAEVISTGLRNKIHVIRLNTTGEIIKNTVYSIQGGVSVTAGKCSIDVFGDINFSYSIQETNISKTVGIVKLDYDGNIINSTKVSSGNLLRGFETSLCISDVSGDPIIFGQVYKNRTQFLFNAESSYGDVTGNVSALLESGHSSGISTIVTDPKYGTYAYNIPARGMLRATTTVTSSSWTLEGWFKNVAITTKQIKMVTITDGSNNIVLELYSVADSSFGKVRLNINSVQGTLSTLSTAAGLISSGYTHIKLVKTFTNNIATYTTYINNVAFISQTSSININPTQIDFGNTTVSNSHGMVVDDIRLSNYAITTASPTSAHPVVDYDESSGYVFKTDKNADSIRLGNIILDNHNYSINRSLFSSINSSEDIDTIVSAYPLGTEGLQILDFNYAISALTQDGAIPTVVSDVWSSRTSTIPTIGGNKIKVTADALDKFYFKYFTQSKVDNVLKLNINQSFDFNIGTSLILKNSLGATIASGKIIETNILLNYILLSDITGSFSLNIGTLGSSDEVINQINSYSFPNIVNTTPGTFVVQKPSQLEVKFKPYSDEDYLVRIDAVLTGSSYVVGSVVSLNSSNFSFNSDFSQTTITGLAAVTQISIVTNLTKILQVDSINNTDLVFVRTNTSHYLKEGSIVYSTTSPTIYDPLTGTFDIYSIISQREFIVKLRDVASTTLTTQTVNIFVKNPIFTFIYGQQYTFDTSDTSMRGHFLSFYRDNLYKIEYTFKNIVRKGIPGFDEPGNSPFISFKVTDDAANISYYADPSNLTSTGPVTSSSYIDVQPSPFIGTFVITDLAGGTVTAGPNRFKFKLAYDPEKNAISSLSTYSTTSTKAVGAISRLRLVSGGGFYKKLPVVSTIESARKIERVDIVSPGTEYEAGEYFGVPILGDGTGGKVSILVDAASDPAGQIIEVTVTDPGKGYTIAFIDIDAVDGILGPGLVGSGAELNVVIPPKGFGASIFTKGENVGKIKKLKNNNFGFNYTHDYTLRPEITFPVNLQLINTSILSSIKVIDPGTGYTTPPEVIIEGGGGSGAIAQSILKNGRISDIIIKNSGSGYSTAPLVVLKSSFTYVINLDLGLFQFAFPHGIANESEVSFIIQDLGEGSSFPLTSFGFIDPDQIYYCISGSSAGLEDDQLRIALTPQDAISGNYISFVNSGTGRQIILTSSFGGSAESVVETGRFLSGEVVYQGDSLLTATATGLVSTNDGWIVGPRILKIVNVDGIFTIGQQVSGVVSRANGTIIELNIAKGVLEVNSITNTVGKFLNDIGKPSEIVQKLQDSYLYQAFSYNVKSPISIEGWRDTLINTTHPAGFKVFGEIAIAGGGPGITNKTDFELTKSVNLIENTVVSNIDSFALVQPIYQNFDNTQILFRNKRLTSSEEILTSVVQVIDNIANLFDGERTSFPVTIDGNIAVANTSQFMIVINGITQSPGTSFVVQQGNIIFAEPPSAPTKISYATATLSFQQSFTIDINNVSGILPELGNTIRGLVSNATAVVISSTTSSLLIFNVVGTFQNDEVIISSSTGLSCNLVSFTTNITDNIFEFQEKITNISGKTAVIEEINLDTNTNITTNQIAISKTSGTYDSPSGLLALQINDFIISAKTGIVAKIIGLSPYQDPATGAFLSSILINDPSSFFGLLFNRIINPLNPNTIVDNISESLIEVTSLTDNDIKVESNFVAFEDVSNIVLDFNYTNIATITTNDLVQNIKINYINETGDFTAAEEIYVKKLSYHSITGGNFQIADTITGSLSSATATVIGINYALKILYLGQRTGSFILEEPISNGTPVNNKVADASDLILANKELIAYEAWADYKLANPSFNTPTGQAQDCIDDLLDIIPVVALNLKYGGNNQVWDAANLYVVGNHVAGEEAPTIDILNRVRDMMIQSMRNEIITINGTHGYTQTRDLTITVDPTSPTCAAVSSSIATLVSIITTAVLNDNMNHATRTNSNGSGIAAKVSNYIETPFIANQVNTANNYIVSGQFDTDARYRFVDAANLLRLNSSYIVDEAAGRLRFRYSDLVIPGDELGSLDGTNRCKLDLSLLLDAVIKDLETGGNYNAGTGARFYLDANGGLEFIQLQVLQSLYAHTQMSILCQDAISGNLSFTPLYTSKLPITPIGITIDPGECADVKSAIDSLWNLINDTISPMGNVYRDAANSIWLNKETIALEAVGYMQNYFTFSLNGIQFSAFDAPDTHPTKCLRDIKEYIIPSIITDLVTGGTDNIISAMEFYIGNGDIAYVKNELIQTVIVFEKVNQLCQYAVDNWIDSNTGLEYQLQYSTVPKYTDPTILTDTGEYGGNCEKMKSTVDTLFNIAIGILIPERNTYYSRYYDASNLINSNKQLIAEVAVGRMLANYPGFSVPNGNQNCIDDVITNLDALIYDLRNGGNARIFDYAQIYTVNPVLNGEQTESIYAFNQARDMAIQAMRNEPIISGSNSTLNQVFDFTITDSSTPLNNKVSDASDLILANKNLIAYEAWADYKLANPSFNTPTGQAQDCIDDLLDIIPVVVHNLKYGGNHLVWDVSNLYVVGNHVAGEEAPTIDILNRVRDMMIQAIRNETITINGTHGYTQVKDLTITIDTANPTCAAVSSSIATLVSIITTAVLNDNMNHATRTISSSSSTCSNVTSSITTLVSILTVAITNNNMNHVTRNSESDDNALYRNAAKLLLFNKEYIKVESVRKTLDNYPGYVIPGGNVKCLRDIGLIIDSVVYDLLTNGNKGIINSALYYVDAVTGTILSLQGELIQSIYAYNQVLSFMKQAVAETLITPSPAAGQYAYADSSISITGDNLTTIQNFINTEMSILLGTLNNPDYIEVNSILPVNSVSIPTKTYPTRPPITPIPGKIVVGDYIYGQISQNTSEIEQIIVNRGTVRDVFKRFSIQYANAVQLFSQGDILTRPGATSNTCIIESIENGEFASYIDVKITNGSFSSSQTLINDDGYLANITSIVNRIQITNVIGEFDANQYAKALFSASEIVISNYDYNVTSVLSTTGSKLVIDTEFTFGSFIPTRKLYSSISTQYIEVLENNSITVSTGDIIQSQYIYKLTVSYNPGEDIFPVSETIKNNADFTNTSMILGYENINSSTAYIYVGNINGSIYEIGTILEYYEDADVNFFTGRSTVTNVDVIQSNGYATVNKIISVGIYKRLYLTNVVGEINQYSQLISNNNYKSGVINSQEIVGRIYRSVLGFDGQQTVFKLTSNNGDQYLPDPDGYVLVFINGILQPPGLSYNTYSDIIEFPEAPDLGSSFSGVYIGKLRQLDDISFDFDSLRSSFNLKLNQIFYSLTITAGSQSSIIRPENNIIISLNGVIQEPGVAFELIGSRVIFAEVPRAGSTFVAFSYIGSDADVIAAQIIPPIEPGDVLEIEGEDQDRTVAVIESSNSLVTFDYLGSVLGRNADALANIITGRVKKLQLTSGGDGYTSRPSVFFDSATGFDAQAKALVGISRVDVINRGSGYAYPTVIVDNVVSDVEASSFDSLVSTFDSPSITFDAS